MTGGSSGIGLEIAKKLASQGLNVVIASLEEPLLHESVAELEKEFPNVQFRKIGCNLATRQ